MNNLDYRKLELKMAAKLAEGYDIWSEGNGSPAYSGTVQGPTSISGFLYEFYGVWEDVYAPEDRKPFSLPLDTLKHPIYLPSELPPYGSADELGNHTVYFVSEHLIPKDAHVRGELFLRVPDRHPEPIVHEWLVDDWVNPMKGDMWRMVAIPDCRMEDTFRVVWTHYAIEYEKVMKKGRCNFMKVEHISGEA
jgi:hypothetical protein